MNIKWATSNQHSEWGLFRVGDVIDTTELKIPAEVVTSWTRDGFAIEMKPAVTKTEKLKRLIKVIKET